MGFFFPYSFAHLGVASVDEGTMCLIEDGIVRFRTKLHGRKTLEFTDVEVSEQFLCTMRFELPHNPLNPSFPK